VAGKRVFALAILAMTSPALSLLVTVLAPGPEGPPPLVFEHFMFILHQYLDLILVSLVYGVSLSSGEIEDGTIGYLVLGAMPRWMVALVQLVVTSAVLAGVMAVGVLAAHLACSLKGGEPEMALWRSVWSHGVVSLAGLLVYLSFFAACGYAFRRGTAVGVIAVLLWELMATMMPVKFAAYTVTNNLRVLWLYLYRDGVRDPFFNYVHNWELPTYGQASRFLAVLAALLLAAAMAALSRRGLEGREVR
jgi:ABC-type maltose transport system permease subunit